MVMWGIVTMFYAIKESPYLDDGFEEPYVPIWERKETPTIRCVYFDPTPKPQVEKIELPDPRSERPMRLPDPPPPDSADKFPAGRN